MLNALATASFGASLSATAQNVRFASHITAAQIPKDQQPDWATVAGVMPEYTLLTPKGMQKIGEWLGADNSRSPDYSTAILDQSGAKPPLFTVPPLSKDQQSITIETAQSVADVSNQLHRNLRPFAPNTYATIKGAFKGTDLELIPPSEKQLEQWHKQDRQQEPFVDNLSSVYKGLLGAMMEASDEAKKEGKPLLVIGGEDHHLAPSMVGMLLLMHASAQAGVKNLATEASTGDLAILQITPRKPDSYNLAWQLPLMDAYDITIRKPGSLNFYNQLNEMATQFEDRKKPAEFYSVIDAAIQADLAVIHKEDLEKPLSQRSTLAVMGALHAKPAHESSEKNFHTTTVNVANHTEITKYNHCNELIREGFNNLSDAYLFSLLAPVRQLETDRPPTEDRAELNRMVLAAVTSVHEKGGYANKLRGERAQPPSNQVG